MQSDERVSLQNLGGGAEIEKFDDALQIVLNNIQDPNTKPTVVREVTLKIKIRPDSDREVAAVDIETNTKLAPASPYATRIYMGKSASGVAEAYEHNINQQSLFATEESKIRRVK